LTFANISINMKGP